VWAGDEAGVFGGEVFLTEVEAGVEERGVVGAVVDYELGFGIAAEVGNLLGLGKDLARPEALVAVLEDLGSGFEEGFGGCERVEVEAGKGGGIEDRVDGRERFEHLATSFSQRPAESAEKTTRYTSLLCVLCGSLRSARN
jgi:hypothetical protein